MRDPLTIEEIRAMAEDGARPRIGGALETVQADRRELAKAYLHMMDMMEDLKRASISSFDGKVSGDWLRSAIDRGMEGLHTSVTARSATDAARMYQAIGERVKVAREKQGLSQWELGALLGEGWSQTKVSMLEQGYRKPSVEDVVKMASELKLDLRDLILGDVTDQEGQTTLTVLVTTTERVSVETSAYRRARVRGRVKGLFHHVNRRKGVVSVEVIDSAGNKNRWEV